MLRKVTKISLKVILLLLFIAFTVYFLYLNFHMYVFGAIDGTTVMLVLRPEPSYNTFIFSTTVEKDQWLYDRDYKLVSSGEMAYKENIIVLALISSINSINVTILIMIILSFLSRLLKWDIRYKGDVLRSFLDNGKATIGAIAYYAILVASLIVTFIITSWLNYRVINFLRYDFPLWVKFLNNSTALIKVFIIYNVLKKILLKICA